jgi:uncharacterized membrane protein YoaK (UPF0700 family)
MPEDRGSSPWVIFGFAFVGGYADAAAYLLADTFTGHITGNFVLGAISVARQDWPTCFRRFSAIALFLTGILFSVTLERFVARRPSWSLVTAVMGIEIVLISTACLALASHLAARLELFISCMSLALGLQNGALRKAGGISVHTTYLTGMVTDLVTTAAERHNSRAAPLRALALNPKVSLICSIWLVFVLGAGIGAMMVFRFKALGILGTALVLLAMTIRQIVIQQPNSGAQLS